LSAVIRGEQVKVRGRKRPIELLFNGCSPHRLNRIMPITNGNF
jgi:hypothetical protein